MPLQILFFVTYIVFLLSVFFLHSIPFVFICLQTKGPLCSVPEYNYYFRMVKAPPPLTSQRRLLFSLSRLADIFSVSRQNHVESLKIKFPL